MLRKIKNFFKKIRYLFSKDKCYDNMVNQGYAENGECCGYAGGDKLHGYLSEQCWDCPYLDWNVVINSGKE